uniref:Mucin-5AC-like n=1 Tax=Phallusia mammillata TaxID=59560 RepID=A0A6F9DM61_9ASCI|nr:mucin-5AC-like [Phallusia mammillata]
MSVRMKIVIFVLSVVVSTFAQTLINEANNCGGDFMGVTGEITSPGFSSGKYPPSAYCVWQITVPFGKQVQLKFESIDIEYAPPECSFDGVVMYDVTGDFTLNVTNELQTSRYIGKARFCGDLDVEPVKSRTNRVVVAFYSDDDMEAKGFNLTWTAVDTPPDQFNCDFEQGLCEGWVDLGFPNDQFDWEFQKRGTRTAMTGPTYDHTLKNENGQYAFIEASLPRVPDDEAILITPEQTFGVDVTEMCLKFWYHMYGSSIGSLKVAIMVGNTSTISWFKSGNQGQMWIEGRLTITHQNEPFRIVFIGVRGRSHQGDIALDDITIEDGSCSPVTTQETPVESQATSTTASATSPPLNCGQFEYECASGTKCVPMFFLCDGQEDCPGNDDEQNCPDINDILPPILTTSGPDTTTTEEPSSTLSVVTSQAVTTTLQVQGCPDDYVACNAGNCIPAFWLCDGEIDCLPDGEDEFNCPDEGVDNGIDWVDYGLIDNSTDIDNFTTSTSAEVTTQTLSVAESTSLATSAEATTTADVTTSVTSMSTSSMTTSIIPTTAETTESETEMTETTETEETRVETTESDVITTVTDAVITATTTVAVSTTQTDAASTTKMLATESHTTTTAGDASIASQTTDVTSSTTASEVTTSEATSVVTTPTLAVTSDDAIAETVSLTPKPVSTTKTTTKTPVVTTTLQSLATGAKRGGDGGAASVRSQSIFVLLLQTLATVFIAMGLCSWR